MTTSVIFNGLLMNSAASSLVLLVTLLATPCRADTTTHVPAARETGCVARAVTGRRSAHVTCHFGRNVRDTRQSIDVQFYPGNSNEPVSLLKCNWLVRRPEEPTCYANEACRFNTTFGETLDLEISNETQDYEGRYVCQLVPSDGIPVQPCRLTVSDDTAVTANHLSDSNSTVTPNTDTPVESSSQVNTAAIGLGVVTLLLAFFNLLLVVTVCRLHRKRQLRGGHRRQENSESTSSSSSTEPCLKTKEPSDSYII